MSRPVRGIVWSYARPSRFGQLLVLGLKLLLSLALDAGMDASKASSGEGQSYSRIATSLAASKRDTSLASVFATGHPACHIQWVGGHHLMFANLVGGETRRSVEWDTETCLLPSSSLLLQQTPLPPRKYS